MMIYMLNIMRVPRGVEKDDLLKKNNARNGPKCLLRRVEKAPKLGRRAPRRAGTRQSETQRYSEEASRLGFRRRRFVAEKKACEI